MLKCDTHIHTKWTFVGDKNMTMNAISEEANRIGLDVVAITDHMMVPDDLNKLNMIEYRKLMAEMARFSKTKMLYGAEVCEVKGSSFTYLDGSNAGSFDVIIGGIHETHVGPGASLKEIAIQQHKHQMMMMENPMINILAHPWWFDKDEFRELKLEWPQDLSFVDRELTLELAEASRRTKTYIEICSMSGLCNKDTGTGFKESLVDFYRTLNSQGAYFAFGSDAHELSEMASIETAFELAKKLQISAERIWQPTPTDKKPPIYWAA